MKNHITEIIRSSMIMSTVTYFFTFTTDILRIWPNYDVNCQKVFGAFFALFSTIMGLRAFFLYQNQCYASFNTGWTCYDEDMQPLDYGSGVDFDAPEVVYQSYLHWQASAGLIGLGVATFAKVLDLLCNFLVPTPSVTRDRDEQWEYEKLSKEDCETGEERAEEEE